MIPPFEVTHQIDFSKAEKEDTAVGSTSCFYSLEATYLIKSTTR